jgi:hypothetical protein
MGRAVRQTRPSCTCDAEPVDVTVAYTDYKETTSRLQKMAPGACARACVRAECHGAPTGTWTHVLSPKPRRGLGHGMCVRVGACARACVYVCLCVCARTRVCGRARAPTRVGMCEFLLCLPAFVCVHPWSECVRARAHACGTPPFQRACMHEAAAHRPIASYRTHHSRLVLKYLRQWVGTIVR